MSSVDEIRNIIVSAAPTEDHVGVAAVSVRVLDTTYEDEDTCEPARPIGAASGKMTGATFSIPYTAGAEFDLATTAVARVSELQKLGIFVDMKDHETEFPGRDPLELSLSINIDLP